MPVCLVRSKECKIDRYTVVRHEERLRERPVGPVRLKERKI